MASAPRKPTVLPALPLLIPEAVLRIPDQVLLRIRVRAPPPAAVLLRIRLLLPEIPAEIRITAAGATARGVHGSWFMMRSVSLCLGGGMQGNGLLMRQPAVIPPVLRPERIPSLYGDGMSAT